MVHNAKQKFVVLSGILSVVITAFTLAALVTPDWLSYSAGNNDIALQGLWERCIGGVCEKNRIDANGQGPLGNLNCNRNGAELADRFRTTGAMIISGAVIAFLVLVTQLVQVFGIAEISPSGHMWLAWFNIFAFLAAMIGVAVFGGTMNSWWNCGSDYCLPYLQPTTDTQCQVGFAYVFCIIGCITLLLAAIVVMIYTKFPHVLYPTADVVLMVSLLEVFSIAMLSAGVAEVNWIEVVPQYIRRGLFQTCTSHGCSANEYPLSTTTRTDCDINGTSLQGRDAAAAAFLIVSAVIAALLTTLFVLAHFKVSTKLLFTQGKKKALLAVMVALLFFEALSLIIATNTYDTYYFCGISFCQQYNGYCHWGAAFGFLIAAIGLTFLMFLMHLFEFNAWCCFQERFASGRVTFSIRKVLQGTKAKYRAAVEAANSGAAPTGGAANASVTSEPVDEPLPLPPGQWDYDSVSGFYWSEELYLFFDPATSQFYDPNKDEWFTQDRRTAAAAAGSGVELMSSGRSRSNDQLGSARRSTTRR